MGDELLTAGKLAKEWGVAPKDVKAAIEKAGKADAAAITAAFWQVDFTGLNGRIKFDKTGPSGKESDQSTPEVYLIKIDGGKVILPKL